jgi:hypothetical protein
MEVTDVQKNYPRISAAANDVLRLLGPGFTDKPEGHVENRYFCSSKSCRVVAPTGQGF